jgi:hypothetical protein
MVWSVRVTVDALVLFGMARGVLAHRSLRFRNAKR